MGEDPKEQPETWELLNEEMRYRIDVQRAAAERIEGKAALVLGASLALVQFVANQDARSAWLPWAISAYALSAALSLGVLWPRRFDEIGPRHMITGLWRRSRGRAAAELVNNRYLAYFNNSKRQGRRVSVLRASALLLVIGAIMSSVHLAGGDRPHGERDGAAGAAGAAAGFDA